MMRFFDPFEELSTLRREIDRAFDGVRSGGTAFRNAFLPGRNPRNYPFINVAADEDALYVDALAPGLDPEKLQITVLGDKLTIAGEKPDLEGGVEREAYHRNERAAGRFTRTFTLPSLVENDKVTAEYSNGILKIVLPKREEAKPRKIEVAVS